MLDKRTFNVLLSMLALSMLLAVMASPLALSDTPTASVFGQITLNGSPVDGATVTCNGKSATTSTSIYQGFYSFSLPVGADYPITATYTKDGLSYAASDNIDLKGLTEAPDQPIGLNALELHPVAAATPTPTPDPNSTVTPTPNATATPTSTPTPTATPIPQQNANSNHVPLTTYTPTPTPTPLPSPTAQVDLSMVNTSVLPRKVFSSPGWSGDHETINVTNNGDRPIVVRAWIENPSNSIVVPVDAGATKTVSTGTILTQNNQILTVGFDAYEEGVPIDSYTATFTVSSIPSPTTARSPGFEGILGLACILGAAIYLAIKKER